LTADLSPLLELRQVSKAYRAGENAVSEVSVSFQRGKLTVLAGESGCGKTTTLKMMNRLEDVSGGSILFDGMDIAQIDAVTLRRSMGWVIQGDGLFPHFTVAENIAIIPKLLGWDPARTELRIRELLDLVKLDRSAHGDRYPSELSGGQRQRVGFARGLAGQPNLLLMDEPFSALDPITRDALQQDFKDLQSLLGFTAIMVTHDMAEALIMADEIVVMRDGRVVQTGTPTQLLASPADSYVERLLETPRRQYRAISVLEP
jgi:osmoprotectant transport system ATP-binding protein